jgi:rhodanese-related sulfurtransferase
MPNPCARHLPSVLLCAAAVVWSPVPASGQAPPRPSVYQTTLEELNQLTPEISTEELLSILATNSEPVFDVRFAKEYAIAHIPGTVNIYEKEVERIAELYPDRSTRMILYCNGPSCGKSKRTSEQLVALGYTNVRRYQLGMPVWRALSQTVQTDMPGFDYIARGDGTAVFVDARTPSEYAAATVPGAVNVQKGEATAANDDGRLPLTDKGTRVVVFGNTAQQARVVAAEIAKKAYWNSSYFGGTFLELLLGGFINHPPVAISRNATVAAGPACTATFGPAVVDGGSFDPDSGDVLTLSLDPAGPFALGHNSVSLVATDSHGASSASASIVTVTDQRAPVIGDLAVDKPVLWPPNHRMELVTIAYTLADNCGPVTTELMISSNDSDGIDSSHRRRPDWEIIDAHHVRLAVEREGHHDRIYWITVVATDGAGNHSAGSVEVRVPSRQR